MEENVLRKYGPRLETVAPTTVVRIDDMEALRGAILDVSIDSGEISWRQTRIAETASEGGFRSSRPQLQPASAGDSKKLAKVAAPERQSDRLYLVSIEFNIEMSTVGATLQELVDLPQQRSTLNVRLLD